MTLYSNAKACANIDYSNLSAKGDTSIESSSIWDVLHSRSAHAPVSGAALQGRRIGGCAREVNSGERKGDEEMRSQTTQSMWPIGE